MINIIILSSDLIFAEMLRVELEDLRVASSVLVNQYEALSEEKRIVVLDLDGGYNLTDVSDDDAIIGFSRNETKLGNEVLTKCQLILHRPFIIDELKNSVCEIIARGGYYSDAISPFFINNLSENIAAPVRLRLEHGGAVLDGKRIGLSSNEYAVLKALYDNLSNPVSREELNRVLSSSEGNMCDVYICHLRSKLEKGSSERYIFTVRGKGYMLKI